MIQGELPALPQVPPLQALPIRVPHGEPVKTQATLAGDDEGRVQGLGVTIHHDLLPRRAPERDGRAGLARGAYSDPFAIVSGCDLNRVPGTHLVRRVLERLPRVFPVQAGLGVVAVLGHVVDLRRGTPLQGSELDRLVIQSSDGLRALMHADALPERGWASQRFDPEIIGSARLQAGQAVSAEVIDIKPHRALAFRRSAPGELAAGRQRGHPLKIGCRGAEGMDPGIHRQVRLAVGLLVSERSEGIGGQIAGDGCLRIRQFHHAVSGGELRGDPPRIGAQYLSELRYGQSVSGHAPRLLDVRVAVVVGVPDASQVVDHHGWRVFVVEQVPAQVDPGAVGEPERGLIDSGESAVPDAQSRRAVGNQARTGKPALFEPGGGNVGDRDVIGETEPHEFDVLATAHGQSPGEDHPLRSSATNGEGGPFCTGWLQVECLVVRPFTKVERVPGSQVFDRSGESFPGSLYGEPVTGVVAVGPDIEDVRLVWVGAAVATVGSGFPEPRGRLETIVAVHRVGEFRFQVKVLFCL